MSSRLYHAVLAAVLTVLATLVVAAPANADDPRTFLGEPRPVLLAAFDSETGEGYCDGFAAEITFTRMKQYAIHTSTASNGDITFQITGRARATVTNLETGESVSFNISGPGTVVFDSAYTILSVDAHGPNLFWTEQRFSFPGVPLISYTTGHVTFMVDRVSSETTSYTLAGQETDVCALLAS